MAICVDSSHDLVFCWNGTTSGVRVPDGDWLDADRGGLAICDATSAAFAMDLPWSRLDVVTWSWQKSLGGEAQHGMLALSPRAIERLEASPPGWPMPKLFRLTKDGRLDAGLFEGATINTPSMLAVEDALDALGWAEGLGGLPALIGRSQGNLKAVADWVAARDWVDFLAEPPPLRSSTAICLTFAAPDICARPGADRRALMAHMTGLLAERAVAHDIAAYRAAPPGLRIWGGPTVETADIERLLPWLDWAYEHAVAALPA